jgi:hypothetical protein
MAGQTANPLLVGWLFQFRTAPCPPVGELSFVVSFCIMVSALTCEKMFLSHQ